MTRGELKGAISDAIIDVIRAQHGMQIDRQRIADLTVSMAANTKAYDAACAKHAALTKQLQELDTECQVLPFVAPGPAQS